ncbi:hypothetical protein CsSME_00033497 [Camellia sinensis var. sinensis]
MLALASTSQPPEAARDCSGAVVAFSPCLPFISSPPNNVSSSLSSQCCDIFNSLFDNRGADCLCYFVRQPLILGFPLNSTRLLSLSSRCPLTNSGSNTNGSLESLCSAHRLSLPNIHLQQNRLTAATGFLLDWLFYLFPSSPTFTATPITDPHQTDPYSFVILPFMKQITVMTLTFAPLLCFL